MGEFFFTAKGLAKLKTEIDRLDTMLKIEIPQALHTAAAHGDLRENGEYQAAKEKQSVTMARMKELRQQLHGAEVVQRKDFPDDIVSLFKSVKIREAKSGKETTWTILGEGDADIDAGIISYQSPMARGLIGKKAGENVKVELPNGTASYEILSMEFVEDEED